MQGVPLTKTQTGFGVDFYFECNKERGPIEQLYIELGIIRIDSQV